MPACPRDGTPLVATPDVFGPNTTANVCPKCAGVFAEWKTAETFFTSLGLSLTDLKTMIGFAANKPRTSEPLHCTNCNQADLRPLVHKGIELDLCESCGAAWFDRGELARITQGKLGKNLAAKPTPGENSNVVGVFEMFWDCAYCDTKALLGASNRFCPNCGAQQDATRRYFPPPGKEVAANHAFDGADRTCPACSTPNGAAAHNCRNCGAPLDEAGEVNRVADRSSAAPKRVSSAPAKTMKKWPFIVGGIVLVLITVCLIGALWKKDVAVTVTAHSWERSIDVETLRAVSETAWCDGMPGGAYAVSRSREQRSTRQIADGQTCTTRDVDRGNGTFERREECKTKYRNEPVYDDRCHFTIDRWQVSTTERATGEGVTPAPEWPAVRLGRSGLSLGSQREGTRTEKYSLALDGKDGKHYSCSIPAARWNAIADGYSKVIPIAVMTGIADCDKL